jgi:hypothetical protein
MFSVRYGPFSFALGAEGSPSYRLNQQYTNVIFDGSIQKQNLAEFGNHERLDDGRTLILAEPNNDWLGPGFCTATNDPPSPAVCRRPRRLRPIRLTAASRVYSGFAAPPLHANANFDSNGTYAGGHGVGTRVDNPDQPNQTTFGTPKSSMPYLSSMHCTGSSISKAGTINCAN